jgi:hypothetical protein
VRDRRKLGDTVRECNVVAISRRAKQDSPRSNPIRFGVRVYRIQGSHPKKRAFREGIIRRIGGGIQSALQTEPQCCSARKMTRGEARRLAKKWLLRESRLLDYADRFHGGDAYLSRLSGIHNPL